MTLEEMLQKVRALPPMTPRQREEQLRNFAAGNVALSNGRSAEEMRAIIDELRGPLPPEDA